MVRWSSRPRSTPGAWIQPAYAKDPRGWVVMWQRSGRGRRPNITDWGRRGQAVSGTSAEQRKRAWRTKEVHCNKSYNTLMKAYCMTKSTVETLELKNRMLELGFSQAERHVDLLSMGSREALVKWLACIN